MSFGYIILIFLAPAWYLTMFLHEAAHVLAAWGIGIKVFAFRPYPHMYEGRFYGGRVDSDDIALLRWQRILYSGSPVIKQVLMLLVWGLAAIGIGEYAIPFMFMEVGDMFLWWKNFFIKKEASDGYKVRQAL